MTVSQAKQIVFASQCEDHTHIDIDPTSVRKNIPVSVPVISDCKNSLKELIRMIDEDGLADKRDGAAEWLDQIDFWRNEHKMAYEQIDIIKPQYVIKKLYELTER